MYFIISMLYYGAEANECDELFKNEVMEVRLDTRKLKINTMH